MDYLIKNKLIYDYQSGFRPRHSTETCLTYLTDKIKTLISKGYYVGRMLLDVQKAFDSVDHTILCDKLNAMGVDPTWFRSYLSDRQQCVKTNSATSSFDQIKSGVPQGSLIGPLLYLCYSNDMHLSVKNELLLYADDSVILVYDKDPNVISQKLAEDLKTCNEWLIDNKLSLHVGKTECILFGSSRKLKSVKNFEVHYDGKVIVGQKSVKYLGVVLDQNLSGQSMFLQVLSKVNNKIKFLYRYKACLNQSVRKKLCAALVLCHFDYCCQSWYTSLTNLHKQKLQAAQNKIVRYILDLTPRSHIGQTQLDTLGLLNISDRVKFIRLNHVFKIRNGESPVYLKREFNSIPHELNTRASSYNFYVPRLQGMASKSFFCNGIKDWNALPIAIKSITNMFQFKRQMKLFLAKCRLELERT